jgi:hypothetical protein
METAVLELLLLSFCCVVRGEVSANLGGTGTRDVMCEVGHVTFLFRSHIQE